MTLTKKRGLRDVLVAVGAVVVTCIATATGFAPIARAAMQREAPDAGAAPDALSWSAPHNVSGSPDVDSEMPALAVTDSGVAHLVWEEADGLYHSYRAAGSWSVPSPIPYTGSSEQPALEVGPDGKVHLVYVGDVDILYTDVFYVGWDGATWSFPKNVSQTGESGEFSQISDSPNLAVASDGSIHVVAVEQTASGKQLYYARSNDGGAWPVYAPVSSAYGGGPSIDVADKDAVHIAYRHDTEDDIYVLDGTISDWSLPENVSKTPGSFSTAPDVALGRGGTADIVWQERIGDVDQVRYSRGDDWTSVLTLSSSVAGAYLPSLTIDTFGYRHVAWDDEALPFAVRHTWTSDPGTWSDPEPIYAGSLQLEDVALYAARDGAIHAAWAEMRGGKGEILYASETFHDVFSVFLPLTLRSE